MNFNLFSSFKLFLKKFERIFFTPLMLFGRNILRKFNPQNIVSKVAGDVKKGTKGIAAKPHSIKQYLIIGDRFVAKKLIIVLVLLLIAAIICIGKFVYPWVVSKFFTRSMWVNCAAAAKYDGKVKLYDTEQLDNLIFEGTLNEGRIEGHGELYNYNKIKIYSGDFMNSEYSGYGKSYFESGVGLEYEGGFISNLYEGEGTLYYENGDVRYTGHFSAGEYNGKGTEYAKGDQGIVYEGDLSNGEYNGYGTLYDEKNDSMRYMGEFVKGCYDGHGTLFDTMTFNRIYDGDFSSNKYSIFTSYSFYSCSYIFIFF